MQVRALTHAHKHAHTQQHACTCKYEKVALGPSPLPPPQSTTKQTNLRAHSWPCMRQWYSLLALHQAMVLTPGLASGNGTPSSPTCSSCLSLPSSAAWLSSCCRCCCTSSCCCCCCLKPSMLPAMSRSRVISLLAAASCVCRTVRSAATCT